MKNFLICWLGNTDLNASKGVQKVGVGPIAQAVMTERYDKLYLLSDHSPKDTNHYIEWLSSRSPIETKKYPVKLSGPTVFEEIHEVAVNALKNIKKKTKEDHLFTFHISPGTSQMAAVWIILSKTRFPAEIIESSIKYGVKTTSIPFDISADFIPDSLRWADKNLQKLASGLTLEAPEFDDIIHRSEIMRQIILKARHVAPLSMPVLLEGESGTGKELFTRAIHKSSSRKNKKLIIVNCGAISPNLIESELFGHEKGAFSGAVKSTKGFFEEAHQGTIFLDEIGELPIEMQVKLLRTVQEGELTRVGSTEIRKVDVRIIAATNKNLLEEVSNGLFREDLFYRLAVAVIKLPPLRERTNDISLLIDHFIKKINSERNIKKGYIHKKISASAKNIMLQHTWPGNIRELQNT